MTAIEDKQLADYLANLASAGVSLPEGLRAAAEEPNSRRTRRRLRQLADRIERGQPLEDVLLSEDWSARDFTSAAVYSGLAIGDLSAALSELSDLENTRRSLLRRLWGKLAYPIVLLTFVLAFLILFGYYFAPSLDDMLDLEMGGSYSSPAAVFQQTTNCLVATLLMITGLCLVGRLALGAARWRWLIAATPVIGPMLQAASGWELAARLRLLISRNVPLERALTVVGNESRDANVAELCGRLADGVRRGNKLSRLLKGTTRIPETLTMLIRWGEEHNSLTEALDIAVTIFEGRLRLKHGWLGVVLPPLIYVAIAGLALTGAASFLIPFMGIAAALSGGFGRPLVVNGSALGLAWLGLVPLGGSLWFAVHVLFAGRRQVPDGFLPFALRVASLIMIFFGTVGVLVKVALFFSLPVVLALLVVIAMVTSRYRAGEARCLVWQLCVAGDRGVPIISTARAFALERTDEIGVRTLRMVNLLEQGALLPDAMALSKLPLSPDLQLTAEWGLGKNELTRSMRQTVVDNGRWTGDGARIFHQIIYLTIVMAFGLAACSFLCIKVLPVYKQIFADFGVELTPLTQRLVNFGDSAGGDVVAMIGVVASIGILLLAIPASLYYIGWLRWEPRLTRWLTARYHGAMILRVLAAAAEKKQVFGDALTEIAMSYPTRYVKRRMVKVVDAIQAGGRWIEALRRQRLITKAAAAVLDSAERVGNLSWALQEMADNLLRNLAFRTSAMIQIVTLAVLILVSIPIGFLVVAMFAPLPALILELL